MNNMHMHNQQTAHLQGNMNHYLLQQHTNMMTHGGPAAHLGHHQQPQIDATTHRSQVHGFAANQQKREAKGGYQSYWSGNR